MMSAYRRSRQHEPFPIFPLLAFAILLLLSSCNTPIGWLGTQSPAWVEIADPEVLNIGKTLHVRIFEGAIWELGDEALSLKKQIQKSLQIGIDGATIPQSNYPSIETLQFPIDVIAGNGRILGSHYSTTEIYVVNLNLKAGIHQVQVEVTGLSGKKYSYSWLFIVKSTL